MTFSVVVMCQGGTTSDSGSEPSCAGFKPVTMAMLTALWCVFLIEGCVCSGCIAAETTTALTASSCWHLGKSSHLGIGVNW